MRKNILKINFKSLISFLETNNIAISTKIDFNHIFDDIKSLSNANINSLTFFSDLKYKNDLITTKAKACFIHKKNFHLLNPKCIPIFVDDPYKVFALSTNFFYKSDNTNNSINSDAFIDSSVSISENVGIFRNAIIKANVIIGKNSIISENAYIGENVIIGENVFIHPNVVITNSIIGKNCIIQSGSIIGDSGFGFTVDEKIPIIHIGNVIIKDNVNIGSCTTIDRASLDSTIIGNNVRIDNLVQIAHSVLIGDNCIIAAQVGVAGSTLIGKNCLIGGQAGISGHLCIGDNVTIAAKSGVTKNIDNNKVVAGFPAIDIKEWKKNIIKFNKIS